MRSTAPASLARLVIASVAALSSLVLPSAPHGAGTSLTEPDKLVILSTSDVKGKTDPCG
jgi:hypothetical protein